MDNNADDLALVEKTIENIKDIATSITANSAIGPKPDPEQVAETTNEQMLLGDAVIAPEAAPALIAPKKSKKRRAAPKKSAKQVARPAAKTTKKAAKKAAKKSSKKSAKKTKSSAGRKTVGKNKAAKKVTKKKAKKSKR
jgi:hypothetical protein